LVLAFAEMGQQGLDRLFWMTSPGPQTVQRRVDDDTVQPGAKARLPLEAADFLESGQEGVLHSVAGVFFVADNAPSNRQKPATMGSKAFRKGLFFAGLHTRQNGCLV
jgi:hypothetical protein